MKLVTYTQSYQFDTYYRNATGDNPPVDTVGKGPFRERYNWRLGEGVRNYKWKIAHGHQATSIASGTKWTYAYQPGRVLSEYRTSLVSQNPVYYRYNSAEGNVFRANASPLSVSHEDITLAENLAREKFYQNLRDAQTSFTGGVFFGELMETVRMLKRPANGLKTITQKWWKQLKKNEKRLSLKKTSKTKNRYLSGLWLETSYGWAPLISDSENAIEAMEKTDLYNLHRQYVRGKGVVQHDPDLSDPHSTIIGHFNLQWKERRYVEDIVVYAGMVTSKGLGNIDGSARRWGFDNSNFVPTVYNLLPWSFLIDYFSTVGKVIDAYSVRDAGLKWGRRTSRRSSIVETLDLDTSLKDNDLFIIRGAAELGKWSESMTSFGRTPVHEVPIPDLRFRLPISGQKWTNMAALVNVMRGKRFSFQ